MKTRKLHYPILSPGNPWGLKPLCRYAAGDAIYALNRLEITCKQCLRMMALAIDRVAVMRKQVNGRP